MSVSILRRPAPGDLPEGLRRLLGLLHRAEGHAAPSAFDRTAITDWDAFAQLAVQHGVVPWLLHRIPDAEFGVPPPVLAFWKRHARINGMRALSAWSLNLKVVAALRAAGIQAVAIKGVATAVRYYGNPGLRTVGDIDLMVSQARFKEACAVLEGLGMVQVFPGRKLNSAEQRWLMRHDHHFLFRQSANGGQFMELHWAMHDNLLLDHQDRQWADAASHTIDWNGHALPVLDPQTDYLLLLTHLARSAWRRLIWIVDAHHAWQALDADQQAESVDALRRRNLLSMHERSRRLAAVLLGPTMETDRKLPRELYYISHFTESRGILTSALSGANQLSLRPDIAYRWSALAPALVAWEDMQLLRLPSALFPLYFLLRLPLWCYHSFIAARIRGQKAD